MSNRGMALVFREWKEMRRFRALEPSSRSIVFYAEDAASRVHFEPMIRELTGPKGREVCYLTSSWDDPILNARDERIHAFCIGSGLVRTWLFMTLKAGLLVMTMPDLETFHIKRSRVCPVHYVYVFHSLVSTHMIYRREAFDHFDTILCAGPHHVREIREAEAVRGLRPKRLVKCGYGRLDSLLADDVAQASESSGGEGRQRRVLVAPSWGPDCLLEAHGVELIRVLLEAGFLVTVRPHPMTRRKWPERIRLLEKCFGADPAFTLETDVASSESLASSDVMVSDYSGAALEYAFGYERPVVFVDVPRKINNSHYREIPSEPIEVSIRPHVGEVISPEHFDKLPAAIDRLCVDTKGIQEQIRNVRSRVVFNTGGSGAVAAEHIAAISDGLSEYQDQGDGCVESPCTANA